VSFDAAGTDLKSVLLNLSSIGFILIPLVWYYFYRIHVVMAWPAKEAYSVAVVLLYVVAYLAPPTGWRRPHPYSDDPRNVPAGTKQH
jgi:hypothetical protein